VLNAPAARPSGGADTTPQYLTASYFAMLFERSIPLMVGETGAALTCTYHHAPADKVGNLSAIILHPGPQVAIPRLGVHTRLRISIATVFKAPSPLPDRRWRCGLFRRRGRMTVGRTPALAKTKRMHDSAGIRTRVRRIVRMASAYDTPTLLNRCIWGGSGVFECEITG
jgi:hypothetical protein